MGKKQNLVECLVYVGAEKGIRGTGVEDVRALYLGW